MTEESLDPQIAAAVDRLEEPNQASAHEAPVEQAPDPDTQQVALLAAANQTLQRDLAERAAIEAELRKQNAVLEKRLEERSADARQQAHEAARTKEFAARLILNSIDGVLAFDRQCCFTLWNPGMERIAGVSADEVMGRSAFDLFPFLLESGEDRSFSETLAGRPVECVDRPYRLPGSGREGFYEAHYAPLRDESGEIVGGLAIVRDITQRKLDQQRILQAERLAAIGEMVSGLAHESRNALQRSQACLDVLSLKIRDRPEVTDLIARIQRAQDRLHTLYEEVRTYAAPITLDLQPCDVGQVLHEAWNDLQTIQPSAGLRLSQDRGTADLQCRADRLALRQVFRNVLENSAASSREPVNINVAWSQREWHAESALQVALEDDGPGLTIEQQRKMFDPFYTTKTQGTGLGLAVAKRIVEAHGGQIAAQAGPTRGARIQIILPRNNL